MPVRRDSLSSGATQQMGRSLSLHPVSPRPRCRIRDLGRRGRAQEPHRGSRTHPALVPIVSGRRARILLAVWQHALFPVFEMAGRASYRSCQLRRCDRPRAASARLLRYPRRLARAGGRATQEGGARSQELETAQNRVLRPLAGDRLTWSRGGVGGAARYIEGSASNLSCSATYGSAAFESE